jgi:seryl-tRNA(Sec) selenium transferase
MKSRTITRPFAVRLPLDVIEDLRAEAATVGWSINEFALRALVATVELCRKPESEAVELPEVVQLVRYAKKIAKTVRTGKK